MIRYSSLVDISKAVSAFIESDNPSSRKLKREIIDRLMMIGDVAVIGGLVRDIALYGVDDRPISDIDLVVSGDSRKLDKIAQDLKAIPNRFGGYSVKSDGFKVDFWSLNKTWAKTAGHVKIKSLVELPQSTFFDWDAIVYVINTNRSYAISRYIERLNSRVLDINLLNNPSIKGNLVRALRRIMMWDARPSKRLYDFIDLNAMNYSWIEIVDAEAGAFHVRYLESFSNYKDYKEEVIKKNVFKYLGQDKSREQLLPMGICRSVKSSNFEEYNDAISLITTVRKKVKRAKSATVSQKSLFD